MCGMSGMCRIVYLARTRQKAQAWSCLARHSSDPTPGPLVALPREAAAAARGCRARHAGLQRTLGLRLGC